MRVAVRTDASLLIGSGHVMRCLTLANALREQGADITFICREHDGHLFNLIAASRHRLRHLLPATQTMAKGKLAHAQWLGVTQEEDAQQTAEVLKTIGHIDWLLIDHYALDIYWESAMRLFADRIMVIDDLADRAHDCDLLLDQNLHRADMESRYEKLVSRHCKKLLGPEYALLRPEFKQARTNLKTRDGNVKRIFVFFGGGDLTNETGKALRAILQVEKLNIAIDVVVGAANPHQEEIAELCAQLPNAKLHRQVNIMAELMAEADVAIGAGGSTTWERCGLALPTIVISLADNQVSIAEGVYKANAQIYLGTAGEVTSETIADELERLLQHPDELVAMAKAGQALVDTDGTNRIVDAIRRET